MLVALALAAVPGAQTRLMPIEEVRPGMVGTGRTVFSGSTLEDFSVEVLGVLENVWCLPDRTAFQIDERMEVIGTKGSLHVQETHPNFSVCDRDGWHSPDTTYWPELHGLRTGALREELSYFTTCIQEGRRPTIITPEESRAAVVACLAAERSAATGAVVRL